MKTLVVALALLLAPALALARPVDGQKRIGFVVEPHLSSSLFSTGATSIFASPQLTGVF